MAAPSVFDVVKTRGPATGGTIDTSTLPSVSDLLEGPGPVAKPTKKKSGGGWLHTVAHLPGRTVVNLGEIALGTVPGLIHTAANLPHEAGRIVHEPLGPGGLHGLIHHPTDVFALTPQGKQYRDLVVKHPLRQPGLTLLTVLPVFSGALGVASRTAAADSALARLSTREIVTTRSPKNVYTGEGPVVQDLTSDRPIVHVREKAKEKVTRVKPGTKRPGGTLGVGGELKRYGATIRQEMQKQALARSIPLETYQKATRGLSTREWVALHIRSFGVHPEQLARVWEGTPDGQLLADPRIHNLVLEPSKRMLRAEPVAEEFANQNLSSLHLHTGGSAETLRTRPGLVRRQVSQLLDEPARPIPEGPEPYYVPHAVEPVRGRSPLQQTGGGKAPPRLPGTMKRNESILLRRGLLHLRSDVLGPEFLRRIKYIQYDEVHDALVRGAVPQTAAELEARHGLPAGWEYVREKATTRTPFTVRGQTETPLETLIPDPSNLQTSMLPERFTTARAEEAATNSKGEYLIVPKVTAKAATGEFTRSSDFVYHFIQRPLTVWRALVLGLRAGFLTNNLVGNSVLYGVKTAGRGGLRDLFSAIVEAHGRETGLRILRNPATPPWMRAELTAGPEAARAAGWSQPDFYRKWFPEQVRGTFGLTQSPSTGIAAGVNKAQQAGRAVTGAIPKVTSKVAEEYPRRALIRNYIRNSPEFAKVWRALPKETRTFQAAAERILEGTGGRAYQRMISRQVNHALGDYLNLSNPERTVLRNTLPFYAWYRAIATVTYHLAVDTPLRAAILGQIGQIGFQHSQEDLRRLGGVAEGVAAVPSFLEGAVGLGRGPGGTVRALSTQGLNPYATLAQLQRGATTDIGNLGLNPFFMGLLQSYARATEGGKQVSPGGLLKGATLGAGYGVVAGLPPVKLVAPSKPSKLYPNRGRKSELLSQFGVPVKEYRPAEAARQAREGR